jgi:hypothetical protein
VWRLLHKLHQLHTRSTKPLYGRFWGILGGMEQKGGSEYRQNRSQLPNVEKR